MIGIVNYGMGNLASVMNAFDYLGIKARIISNPTELKNQDKILLPGVGAFGRAMENLNKTGFSEVIKEQVIEKKKPILGICLGMQLLMESSTEHGLHKGLDIVKGRVLYFGDTIRNLTIPHVGWNEVEFGVNSKLFSEMPSNPTFYFVHSYYCELTYQENIAGITDYGILFHSVLEKEHIFGCQFHPEKSQKNGLSLFRNFNML